MALTFVALRSALFAGAFLRLWAWVALLLRPYDDLLGGLLPAWTRVLGQLVVAAGGVMAVWCIGMYAVYGRGTPALFDAPLCQRTSRWIPRFMHH